MMIVRLDREHRSDTRKQLLSDPVYVFCHEALRKMMLDGQTRLSPPEVVMSARNVCKAILDLPDIEEGLDDELDDLKAETDCDNDFTLIMAVAAAQLQALGKKRRDIDVREINFRIIQRLSGHPLLWPLYQQMSIKEEACRRKGVMTSLIDYELKEIETQGGGSEEIRQFLKDLASEFDHMAPDGRKELLIYLDRYNIDHGHAYDKETLELHASHNATATNTAEPREYVNTKIVAKEVSITINTKTPGQKQGKKAAQKPKTTVKPMTLKYYNYEDKKLLAKQQKRVDIVFRMFNQWQWIDSGTKAEDFDALFKGTRRNCNITWKANSAILTILLQELLKQPYIEKQTGCSAKSLVEQQFGLTPNSDRRRLKDAEEKIQLTLYLLDINNPLPLRNKTDDGEEFDLSEAALMEVYAGNLRKTKGI